MATHQKTHASQPGRKIPVFVIIGAGAFAIVMGLMVEHGIREPEPTAESVTAYADRPSSWQGIQQTIYNAVKPYMPKQMRDWQKL